MSDDILNDGTITKSTGIRNYKDKFPPEKGWNNNHMVQLKKQYANDEGSYSRYFDLDAWYDELTE